MGVARNVPRAAAIALAAAVLASCSPHPGRLVVVVRTDFDVPAELTELVVRVGRTDRTSMEEVPFGLRAADAPDPGDGTRTMPLSFAVHPRDDRAEVEIDITGLRAGARTPLVRRRAIVGFVPGTTRVLDLFLAEACSLDVVVCRPEETCIDGRCQAVPTIDPADLPVLQTPGDELDAGPAVPEDASTTDSGVTDAGVAIDADASALDASILDAGDSGCVLAAPTPLAPRNGAATGGRADARRPTFEWSASCAGATYELEVDDSCITPGFAGCAFASPELRAADLTTTSHQPATPLTVSTTVPVGRRYYWRVRACLGATCGDWSDVRYLDVGRIRSDVDGDGFADVVVGARDQDANAGAAYLHRGSASGLAAGVALAPGGVAGDHFGFAVAYAGDLDGDGFGDLVVGADEASHPERNEGVAYVYLGSAAGITTPAVILDNPDADPVGRFGWSVSGVGDLDADGFDDLAVGAPYQDGLARDAGRVFVYRGGGPTGVAATADVVLEEPAGEMGARFGHAVRGVGDVDGDGYADLAVGAVQHDGLARDSGAAFVYRGGPSGVSTTPFATLSSADVGALLGACVAGADLNGDGYSDVVVGASYYSSGASAEGGAFVFYGSPSGLAPTADLHLDNPTNDANAWFGDSLAAAGDLDGDGIEDLVVGALFANAPENDEGNAYVYFGDPAGIAALPDVTIDNPADASTASFGVAVASAGDVNDDGVADLIVGAYQQPIGGNNEGAAFVFFGRPGFAPVAPDVTLLNPMHTTSGRYGYSVAGTGR